MADKVELNSGVLEDQLFEIDKYSRFNTEQVYNSFHDKKNVTEDKKKITKTIKKLEDILKRFKKESNDITSRVNKTLKNNKKILTKIAKKASKKKDNEINKDDLKDWKRITNDVINEKYSSVSPFYL